MQKLVHIINKSPRFHGILMLGIVGNERIGTFDITRSVPGSLSGLLLRGPRQSVAY